MMKDLRTKTSDKRGCIGCVVVLLLIACVPVLITIRQFGVMGLVPAKWKGSDRLLGELKSRPLDSSAVREIGRRRDARAIDRLIEILNEASGWSAKSSIPGPNKLEGDAAIALVEIGDPRAIIPLLRAADAKGADARIKSYAERALTKMRDREVPALIEGLNDPSRAVRQRAVHELGDLRDVRAVEPLLQALSDGAVQEDAVQALGKIGSPAVEPLLTKLKRSNREHLDDFVIMNALAATKDHRATLAILPFLQTHGPGSSTSVLAARALGRTGDQKAVAPLISAMENGNGDAQAALVEIGQPAIPALLERLGKSSVVSYKSADALGMIGKPAVRALIQKFEHSLGLARLDAARALSEIDDAEVSAVLSTALSGGDLSLVAAAHRFLVRRGDPQSKVLLIRALIAQTDSDMAESLLNCGDPALEDAARMWAKRHGYQVSTMLGGGGGTKWGNR